MFHIDVETLCWLNGTTNGTPDNPKDLCLHGNGIAQIGDETFAYKATVSAAGLYLLRTLTENHIYLARSDHAMLPCCGHFMMANKELDTVDIIGCDNGVDWSVIHEAGKIKLITETKKETFIDMDEYTKEVYRFTDKIEAYYKACYPKDLTDLEDFERDGYIAFWNEWNRRKV